MNTYKAVLKGNTLEWSDEAPDIVGSDQAISVHVTILDRTMLRPQRQARGQKMAAALERLAAKKGIAIDDPSAWQQDVRQDRSLAERDGPC